MAFLGLPELLAGRFVLFGEPPRLDLPVRFPFRLAGDMTLSDVVQDAVGQLVGHDPRDGLWRRGLQSGTDLENGHAVLERRDIPVRRDDL